MTNNDQDPMLERVKQELQSGNDKLEAQVLSRLNQARQKALAQAPQAWWKPTWLGASVVPAGTLAAVVLAVAVFFQTGNQVAVPETVDDLEVLMAEESLELYEDLEFYVWLEEVEANAG